MNYKTQGIVAVIAALLVLLSAMVDARTSLVISLAALLGLGVYNLTQKRG